MDTKIAVLGDVMLDEYWYSHVDRISPEAPVPVALYSHSEMRLGGAANVAHNLASIGTHVDLYGVIGEDDTGDKILELCETAEIKSKFLRHPTFTSTKKLRIMSGNSQLLRCDFEQKAEPTLEYINSIINKINEYKVIVLSDYGKGVLTHLPMFLKHCFEQKIPTFVDPKSNDINFFQYSEFLKPNEKEFRSLFKCDLDNINTIMGILNKYSIQNLIVTMGAKGVRYFTSDGMIRHFDVPEIEVFDVTGAGDTFSAAFCHMISAKRSIDTAIAVANLCARSVVNKVGTSILEEKELDKIMRIFDD